MRKLGYHAETVEHRLGMFIRKDLFGFIDTLAYKEGEGIIAIQAHNSTDSAKLEDLRHEKFTPKENENIRKWILANGRFELHLWKYHTKNKRKYWHVERKEIKM